MLLRKHGGREITRKFLFLAKFCFLNNELWSLDASQSSGDDGITWASYFSPPVRQCYERGNRIRGKTPTYDPKEKVQNDVYYERNTKCWPKHVNSVPPSWPMHFCYVFPNLERQTAMDWIPFGLLDISTLAQWHSAPAGCVVRLSYQRIIDSS